MNKIERILRLGFILIFAILLTCTGCAVKKNPWAKKKSKVTHVSASQLGRNRYYYSVGYQKRLTKSVKKKSY